MPIRNGVGVSVPRAYAGYAGGNPLLTGMVDWWTLNEASGNRVGARNGSIMAPTNNPLGVAGKIGNGCDFVRASSQYLSCTTPAVLAAFQQSFSVAMWCNPDALGSEDNWFWMAEQTMVNPCYAGIRTLTGNQWQGAVLANNLAESSEAITGTVSAATWQHLVLVYDSVAQVTTLYFNATPASGPAMTIASSREAPASFVLGSRLAGGQYVDGIGDEVGLWNRALSQGEVNVLYNGGAGITYSNLL